MKAVIVLALIGATLAHDLTLGSKGTKIFEEHATASPAIWRQIRNVTVNNNSTDVISRIVIRDLRPDKNGDVSIIEGGLGQKNITLELKSPTVFRGYDFQIEVYAMPEEEFVPEANRSTIKAQVKPIVPEIVSPTPKPLDKRGPVDAMTPKNVPAIVGQHRDANDQTPTVSQPGLPGNFQPGLLAEEQPEAATSVPSVGRYQDEAKVKAV